MPQTTITLRAWALVAGYILIVAVLYSAQVVLVPVAIALLLTFWLTPVVSAVERWIGRVPAVLAAPSSPDSDDWRRTPYRCAAHSDHLLPGEFSCRRTRAGDGQGSPQRYSVGLGDRRAAKTAVRAGDRS